MQKLWNAFDYKPNILLPIFAFFLPLLPQISQVAMLLYLIFWFVNRQYKQLFKIKQNPLIWLVIYMLMFIVSGLYSSNLAEWGMDVEAKVPLLVIPVIMICQSTYEKKLVDWTLGALALGCIVFSIYVHYQQFFNYKPLRSLVGKTTFMNVIYYTMYFSFVLFWGIFQFFKKSSNRKWWYLVVVLVAHYTVFAMASRMGILAMVAVEISAVFIWKIWFEKKWLTGLVAILAIIIINGLSLYLNSTALSRFQKISSGKGDVRSKIWEASWLEFKKSPIIGYGAGDTKDVLRPTYNAIGYPRGAEKNQNSHNQYLETGVSIGIIGILVFLLFFWKSWWMGWNEQHYLLCIFIIIVALNMLTESMLERQQGTYFVAFFGSLLCWKVE